MSIRMLFKKSKSLEIVLLLLYLLILPRSAHAYLDPGTGSFIFQVLIAGLLGALFTVKIFWVKIKNFLAGLFSKRQRR